MIPVETPLQGMATPTYDGATLARLVKMAELCAPAAPMEGATSVESVALELEGLAELLMVAGEAPYERLTAAGLFFLHHTLRVYSARLSAPLEQGLAEQYRVEAGR